MIVGCLVWRTAYRWATLLSDGGFRQSTALVKAYFGDLHSTLMHGSQYTPPVGMLASHAFEYVLLHHFTWSEVDTMLHGGKLVLDAHALHHIVMSIHHNDLPCCVWHQARPDGLSGDVTHSERCTSLSC